MKREPTNFEDTNPEEAQILVDLCNKRKKKQGKQKALLLDVTEPIITDKKIGRNDPCPCNSNKKYKKCCG